MAEETPTAAEKGIHKEPPHAEDSPSGSKYRVIGSRAFNGHRPGATFTADLSPGQEARAVERGAIEVVGKEGDKFSGMTRNELNQVASAAGIYQPESLENKAAVIKAITANAKKE